MELLVAPGFNPGMPDNQQLQRAKRQIIRAASTFWRATLQPLSGKLNHALTKIKNTMHQLEKLEPCRGGIFVTPGFNPELGHNL